MWKCRNCETVNNGEICVICGAKKPEALYRQEEERQKMLSPEYGVRRARVADMPKKGKEKNTVLRVLIICIAFVLTVFSLILAEELVYHKAQYAASSGNYDEAIRCYSLIKFRSNVPAKLVEAEYKQAELCIEYGDYDKAHELIEKTGDYKESARLREYLNIRRAYSEQRFHEALMCCEGLDGFKDVSAIRDQIVCDYYEACVELYHRAEYKDAMEGFLDIKEYDHKDTYKYLLLTQAHQNVLTDVSALYGMFDFEDTKQLVLTDRYIVDYLLGRWSDAKGNYLEYYEKNGITCRTNLQNDSGAWYISDGVQYIKNGSRDVKQWEIRANDFDEIEVFSFINNKRYILWRR